MRLVRLVMNSVTTPLPVPPVTTVLTAVLAESTPSRLENNIKLFSGHYLFELPGEQTPQLLHELCLVVDTGRISASLPANYTIIICNQTSSYQDTQTMDFGFTVIYICLLVSSAEIVLYHCFHDVWRRLLVGEILDEEFYRDTETEKDDKIVQLEVNIIMLQIRF